MEYEGKTKSPYHGIIGSSLLLILIPVALFIFVLAILETYTRSSISENINTSLMLGCGSGLLFQLSCAIAGLFKGTFKVVLNRIKSFFENLSVNFKFAIKYYWEDVKSEGVVFWIYFLIIGTDLGFTIYGTIKSIELYLNYQK